MTPKEYNSPTRVASRDGTGIAYYSSGEGPPLLLVHGVLSDHSRWAPLLPYLEPRLTVHTMDRRGRGASGDHEARSCCRPLCRHIIWTLIFMTNIIRKEPICIHMPNTLIAGTNIRYL